MPVGDHARAVAREVDPRDRDLGILLAAGELLIEEPGGGEAVGNEDAVGVPGEVHRRQPLEDAGRDAQPHGRRRRGVIAEDRLEHASQARQRRLGLAECQPNRLHRGNQHHDVRVEDREVDDRKVAGDRQSER